MIRAGRILIVTSEQELAREIESILVSTGFQVVFASTYQDMLTILTERHYHLVIWFDVEGMELFDFLANYDFLGSIKFLICSDRITREQKREGYREHKTIIVNFLKKEEFTIDNYVSVVQQIFTDEIMINFDLEIEWKLFDADETQQHLSHVKLVDVLPELTALTVDQVKMELDALLCHLFYTAQKITVWPSTPNPESTGLLWVQPDDTSGVGQLALVKYGHYRKIEEELQNYKIHVEQFIGGEQGSWIIDYRRTHLLGGIIYTSTRATDNPLIPFRQFYKDAKIPQIEKFLDNFREMLDPWYTAPETLEVRELGCIYEQSLNLSSETLEADVQQRLQTIEIGTTLRFKALPTSRNFRNPLGVVGNRRFPQRVHFTKVHGNLNADNLLVDTDGQAYLVDFSQTGSGHILRDIAALDSLVRLQLLDPDGATLDERLAMEEALCQIKDFSQLEEGRTAFVTENSAVAKAYHSTIHLRRLVHQLSSQNPSSDISELYIALLYHALHTIRLPVLTTVQREHALLSASLLLETIDRIYDSRIVELKLQLSETEQLSKRRFEYLSTASHELNRPIGRIKWRLQSFQNQQYGLLNARQKRELDSALADLNHEIGMINRMLDLTKLEAGKVKMEPESCNMIECLRSAIGESREELQNKNLDLKLDLPEAGIVLVADPQLIRQAFSNVFHNAVKFTQKGEINVSCKVEMSNIVVEVKDTGCGIAPDALSRVFEPYYQADRSPAREYSGLGAGLYLVKSWVELHGGSVHVNSVVNQGSTFRIKIPMPTSMQDLGK